MHRRRPLPLREKYLGTDEIVCVWLVRGSMTNHPYIFIYTYSAHCMDLMMAFYYT